MAIVGKDITLAAELLKKGDLVSIPTETVYGLAGNALNLQAVSSIFEVKNRPRFDPLILHVDRIEKIGPYAELKEERLVSLSEKFMPGPLTILLPKTDKIDALVTSGLDRVAFRIPEHPMCRQLLSLLDFPLAAPSANPFGYVSPTCAEHVNKQLGEKISYILDGGRATVGLESTIVGVEEGKMIIYRIGGLAVEQIEDFLREKVEIRASSSSPSAPGMLKKHYSPNKLNRWYKVNDLVEEDAAYLLFSQSKKDIPEERQLVLSPNADLAEAARNLFNYLRILDQMSIRTIYIEKAPNIGLGRAINDRFSRAIQED